MSVVYRAHDRLLDRQVALKLLRLSEDEPHNLLFLQQEFRAMARLRHPRLVQVFDYGVLDSGSAYFTMELLAGQDLSSLARLSLESILQVLVSIADVLGFMHARGYVHRDVKPSNVRVLPTEPGQAVELKLMDCGLTEQLGRGDTAVAGTLAYLAPEAWLGAPTDVRGDLYALGVLAYEITAGQLPFDASTGVRLLKTKTERPPDLRQVRPDVPVEFARLVRDLLAPEPVNRPASAMEVLARLCEFADIDFNPDSTVYLRTPALVGRNHELAELRDAIATACSGKPRPTVIVGPPGAGKTRLLEEVLLETGVRGAVIARATGRGFAGAPYEVMQELLAPLSHLPEADGVLLRIGGKSALGLGRSRSVVDATDRNLDPIAARRALHMAFATFLDGISKHRMVILAIDDIHNADAASLDALASLIGAGVYGNIAIIATQRAGELVSQSLAHFLTISQVLKLDRMTRAQIEELLVGALGPVTPSPRLVEDLERVSSGNVYFVLEILRDLTARRLIERKRTRILLPDSLDASGLPESLSEALERRLAQLSVVALALARIGAVVGRAIDFEFARILLGKTDDEFLDAIDDLRREELIDIQDRRLRVHHPRLREVVYQGMGPSERQTLHQHVAEMIRKHEDEDEHDRAAELGHHYAEAGDAQQALEYLVKAGDARYHGFAYFDAREAYLRAFELLHAAPHSHKRELERKLNDRLGRICFYHDHKQGPKYLDRARRYHLRYGMLWAIAPLSRLLGAAIAVAFGVLATALFNALQLRSRPLKSTLERLLDSFAATTYLSNCYTYSGRMTSALDAAEQLVPFVYSKRRLPRVGYLMARVYALVLMNRFDEAAAGSEEALAVLQYDRKTPLSEHDRVHATGGALITRLWVDVTRGYSKRSRFWQPLEEYIRLHPTALLESWLMEVRVYAAFREGKLKETEQAWTRFLEKASQAEVVYVESKAKVWVGMTYLDAGRTSDAQDMADEVVRVGRSLDNPMLLALGLQLRGMALHAWEQLDDAGLCLQEAARLTAQDDVASWELHHSIQLALAALELDRGNLAKAKELALQVEQGNSSLVLAHDLHRCRAQRILGKAALLEGRTSDAVQRLQQAVALAMEIDDSLERARTLHSLAEALVALGDTESADQRSTECAQLLNDIGNTYQLRRLGYAVADDPDSVDGVTALLRSMHRVSETELQSTLDSIVSTDANGSDGEDSARKGRFKLSDTSVADETLVAADANESFSRTLD
jgi:tetratricopeptide (TPR) repeat protein